MASGLTIVSKNNVSSGSHYDDERDANFNQALSEILQF